MAAPFWLPRIALLFGRSETLPELAVRHSGQKLQVFCLPAHRVVDAIPAAKMVEEDPLLDCARVHLAVLAEMNGSLREAVRLSAGVQAVHVGLVFVRADVRVKEWRVYEVKKRTQKEDQRKHVSPIPRTCQCPPHQARARSSERRSKAKKITMTTEK